MKRLALMLSAGLLGGLSAQSQAQTVSFNYDVNGGVPTSGSDFAGVVNAANWNSSWTIDGNAGGGNSTYSNLIDDSGNPTSIDLTTSTAFLYSIQGGAPGPDADTKWNRNLLNGYLNSGTTSTPAVSKITLAEVPYSSYDVYVYFGSDDASRTGTVSDGTTTYDFNVLDGQVSGANALFAQTTSTGGAQPEANYAVFSGLSGASKTFTVDVPAFGGISGIQIVNTGGETAPVFTLQPVNTSAGVDYDATFTASASANPAATLTWQYSPDGVSGWLDFGVMGETLTITGVQFFDEMYYRVVADNGFFSTNSDVVFLDVYYAAPEFFDQPEKAYAVEGSTVELTADAFTYGNPSYQWYKDGAPLAGETDYILVLTGVDAGDDGEYFLRVTDDIEAGVFGDSDTVRVAVFPAWDGVVSYEPFSTAAGYALGELPAQDPSVAGYEGPWIEVDNHNAQPEVISGSLNYPDPLYLNETGAQIGKGADAAGIGADNAGRTYRQLAPAVVVADNTTGVRYLSWLYRNGNENAADNAYTYSTLALYQDTGGVNPSGDAARRIFEAGISDGNFGNTNYGFRYDDSLAGDLMVPVDSNVHLFVVKFDLSDLGGSDSMTVWVDPELGSGEPLAGGVTLEFLDIVFDSICFSDYASNSMAWDEVRWGSTFDSVTLNPNPGTDFAAWIAGYPGVGVLSGFDDDADGDGLTNGEENYLGTDPTVFNQGVTDVAKSGNTFTFQHPQNASPASDVSGAYRWSLDMASWNASGASSNGTTVVFSASPDTPIAGITTVTATITGTPVSLFADLSVTQSP